MDTNTLEFSANANSAKRTAQSYWEFPIHELNDNYRDYSFLYPVSGDHLPTDI